MYGGLIIGSHQYFTLRSWLDARSGPVAATGVELDVSPVMSGVSFMWQIGHSPGWS
jgi:hypothetical protein